MEFDYASNGTIGLESAFGALNTIFPLKTVIKLLTKGKDRFGIKDSSLNVGNQINATLFNPNGSYTFTKNLIGSKSKNCMFLGSKLKGRVYGVANNNKLHLN